MKFIAIHDPLDSYCSRLADDLKIEHQQAILKGAGLLKLKIDDREQELLALQRLAYEHSATCLKLEAESLDIEEEFLSGLGFYQASSTWVVDLKPSYLIDFDGTMVNSLTEVKRLFFETFEKATPEDFDRANGPPLTSSFQWLKEKTEKQMSAKDFGVLLRLALQKIYPKLEPAPGLVDFLETLRQRDEKAVIVTSNQTEIIQQWIKNNYLEAFFEGQITADDVAHGKPHPEPYLLACSRFRCCRGLSFAFEDSLQGRASAVAAYLKTVDITKMSWSEACRKIFG